MKFIAHRGESAAALENTLEAFQLAWDNDISTVELDVHLCKDGEIIVMHDANLLRTFGTDALIKNLTLAEMKNPPDLAHARIYDRILERCAPILFSGKNFRKENATDARMTAKKIVSHEPD